jgi:hypothetical protein
MELELFKDKIDLIINAETAEIKEKLIKDIYRHYKALELRQFAVSGSNLQQYLVSYKKTIESSHPLLNDDIITVSQIVEVSNPIEINSLFKNIVDVKRIS